MRTTLALNGLSGNYSENLFDHPEKMTADMLKPVSKRKIYKRAEASGDLL